MIFYLFLAGAFLLGVLAGWGGGARFVSRKFRLIRKNRFKRRLENLRETARLQNEEMVE